MKSIFFSSILNCLAFFLLSVLIIAPIYFANNFSRVAGDKTQSNYLLISQTEKFPQMQFSQKGFTYTLTFSKFATSQTYLEVLILNNPTQEAKTYNLISKSSESLVFFGNDWKNPLTKIKVPPGASVPISILSKAGDGFQTVEFTLN